MKKYLMLEFNVLSMTFGGVQAIHNVLFRVKSREGKGKIWPYGVGRSTLVHLISGLFRKSVRFLKFDGARRYGLAAPKSIKMGLGHTF